MSKAWEQWVFTVFEGAVELDRVLNDDEAVFGVLEGGDEEAADKTEDEEVALHGGLWWGNLRWMG